MIVLGIETSCDETAVAVFDGEELLSNIINTQEIHRKYGGVVPELASREHLKNIIPVTEKALLESNLSFSDIDLIAVTQGPGLIGSLLIGISFAKAAAFSGNLPIIGVNHIEAHLWAPVFEHPEIKPPFIALIISGGHTQLWWVRDFGDYVLMGQTVDDAVGEAFDKVAQMLGLDYPGGPVIDRLSRSGDPDFAVFPRPAIKKRPLDFSFSGLKTSVLYYLDKLSEKEKTEHIADIAASFQQAVVDTLIKRTFLAAKEIGVDTVIVGGGVAANSSLKKQMLSRAAEQKIAVHTPSIQYCTDNAAMIAYTGRRHYMKNGPSDISFSAYPSMRLSESVYSLET